MSINILITSYHIQKELKMKRIRSGAPVSHLVANLGLRELMGD